MEQTTGIDGDRARDDEFTALFNESPEPLDLIEKFRATRDELEVLARYYFEYNADVSLNNECYGQEGGMWELALERMETIRRVMGERAYGECLAGMKKKWKRTLLEMRMLPRCGGCGQKFHPRDHNFIGCAKEKMGLEAGDTAGGDPEDTPS